MTTEKSDAGEPGREYKFLLGKSKTVVPYFSKV